jgi:SAM-dependent methyltransferase
MITEVQRWRGSAGQQAQRAQTRKLGQFAYFDRQLGHPAWRGKRVLDFGGSDGNLLWNPDCAIRPENYYCIDVVRDAIEDGRNTFPSAHWIHYDRYNCSFNPLGIANLPIPDMGVAFDVILAYSVFTHTTREEMHDLVEQLCARLATDGVLAFTFEDPSLNLDARLAPPADIEWCALVDGRALFVNDNGRWSEETTRCMTYDVYYTAERMQCEFPDAAILPPVNGERQHCCVIRK